MQHNRGSIISGGYGDVPAARKGGCAVTTSSEDLRKEVREF